ncbi:MAG: ATP-binding protein, partial [Lentisphaeraceae bacterium]|nr:ATP-binding protein [Lentisphaeraceae bacterium]
HEKDKILTSADEELTRKINAGSRRLLVTNNGEPFIGNYEKRDGRTLVILQSRTEVLDYFSNLFRNILVVALCVAVIAFIIGLKLSQSLTRPIEDLNEAILKFKAGENDARAKVTSEDEIGELAEEFNLMLKEVLDFRIHMEELVKTRTAELETAKDEAESANRAKSSFLANMSHEIRTPMNAILGFAQILHQMENDEEKKKFLASIITGGKTLLSIINDILDLSKIEAGKFSLMLSQASVKTILDETCTILNNEAANKNIELNYKIDETFPQMVIVDELRLRQILINLVGNAVKFTDIGSVSLSARYSYIDELKKFVSISIDITDTGIGISEDEQESIFNDFVQSERQGDKLYQGTGLGLAICRKLILLMNGKLEVESQINKGSTFRVTLPKIEVSEIMVEDEDYLGSLANAYLNFEASKVLLVDDNEENLNFIYKLLEGHNLILEKAVNGEEAIKIAQEFCPSLILMDLKMPKLNGYQAAETIRSNPHTAKIPILAISASIVDDKADSFKTLFDDFIPKPVSSDKLFKSLIQHLPHSYTKKGIKV